VDSGIERRIQGPRSEFRDTEVDSGTERWIQGPRSGFRDTEVDSGTEEWIQGQGGGSCAVIIATRIIIQNNQFTPT
jgi:hypothetical protein